MRAALPRGGVRAAAALAAAALAGAPPPATAHAGAPAAPTSRVAWTARIVHPTVARTAPAGARPAGLIATTAAWNGGPVGLLVLDARTARDGRPWLRVLLPRRPNGSSAWIRADRAVVRPTRWSLDVSLRARRIDLLQDGVIVASSPAVIGAPGTPTPRGRFAISERVRQPDPHGFLGPWALHLTAFSNVLDDYGGGPGRVAIHGRDGLSLSDPLGTAASHGCLRVPDAFVRRLSGLREGTPVRVR